MSRNLVCALSLAQSVSPPLHRRGNKYLLMRGQSMTCTGIQCVRYLWLKAYLLLFIGGGNKYLLMRGQQDMYRNLECALSLAQSVSPPLHRRGNKYLLMRGQSTTCTGIQFVHYLWLKASLLLFIGEEKMSPHRRAKHDMYRSLVCALSLAQSVSPPLHRRGK